MIEVRLKDIIVRSGHPEASEMVGYSIATVFDQYRLEGHPENEPLGVTMTMDDGTEILYEVHPSPRN